MADLNRNLDLVEEYCNMSPKVRDLVEKEGFANVYATTNTTLAAHVCCDGLELYVFTGGAGERSDSYFGRQSMFEAIERDSDLKIALADPAQVIANLNRNLNMIYS